MRKTFYGATRKAVRDQLTKALRNQQLGLPVAPERQTTGAFLKKWLEGTAKPRLRSRTYADYAVVVMKHLVPSIGNVPLQKLGPEHIQELMSQKTEAGLAPRRVRLIRAVLHTALAEAARWGLTGRNVVDLVKAPRAPRYEPTVLNQKLARAFVKAAAKHRIGALFSVALAVGLRLGEALALSWGDVDLVAGTGTLTVRRALQRVDDKLQFVEPKTEKSRRTIPLPQATVTALKRHRTRQKKERLLAGGAWQQSDLVFTSTVGTALDERNVRRAFKDVLKAAKLPKMRIHDLRHTCATLLLAAGVHPKVVGETLGHSQISLTLDTYSTVLPSVSRAAAEEMNAVLSA